MQPIPGNFQRAMRHVHSDDFGELLFLQQELEQTALAATQIQDTRRADAFQSCHYRAKPLLIQANRLFDDLFFHGSSFSFGIGIEFAVTNQLRQGIVDQAPLMLQITAGDSLAFRMRREPAFAVPQKLLDFFIAHPVMFFVVQHRHQNVNVRQKFLQRNASFQFDPMIGAFTPVGKILVQRQPARSDGIAERRE